MTVKIGAQQLKTVGTQLDAVTTDYQHQIGWGDFPNRSAFRAHGANLDVDAADEILGDMGGVYPYPTTAQTLKISSDSAEDAVGGDGTATVYIWGLDDNYIEINETKTLEGASVVDSANQYLRLFGVRAVTPGSGSTTDSNVGTITIQDSTETDTLGLILPGKGRTRMALWTVPAGKEVLLCQVWGTATGTKLVHLHLHVRRFGESWVEELHFSLLDEPNNIVFTTGFYCDEKSDLELRTHSTATNAIMDGGFCGNFRNKAT